MLVTFSAKQIILEAVQAEEFYKSDWNEIQCFRYILERVLNEKPYEVKKYSVFYAIKSWLQGMGLSALPIYDIEVEKLGFTSWDGFYNSLALTILMEVD
tara:strand:+ start:585 stop:881 length:297 start_codon:yes stop_codon:yes gene_type:complete